MAYGIAAFRSRQQVLAFEAALRRAGLEASVIHTPHEIAIGCGLSVRFRSDQYDAVRRIYERHPMTAFVGFYLAEPQGTRLNLKPMYQQK